MTNIVPQNSTNNRGFWQTLERDLRELVNGVVSERELYIITGASGKQNASNSWGATSRLESRLDKGSSSDTSLIMSLFMRAKSH